MTDEVFKRLQDYVGREYRVDYNCAHLARDVQSDLFGRVVALPGAMPAGAAGQRRAINAMRDELAMKIDVPFPGCAAVLLEQGLTHIGTVAMRQGEPWILHNSHKLGGACLHRLSDLQRWGMTLDGWYAWK